RHPMSLGTSCRTARRADGLLWARVRRGTRGGTPLWATMACATLREGPRGPPRHPRKDGLPRDAHQAPPNPQRKKTLVLDTSVILYDWNALHNFQEHDVAIPITVLEELDQFKKGNSVLNLQAREFIRQLDKLSGKSMLDDWIPLDGPARGRFRVLTEENGHGGRHAAEIFGAKKPDHRILSTALGLAAAEPHRRVILVSKDINLRLKARAL